MTAPARFTKSDIKRAMSGAREAGYSRVRVGIDAAGNIVIDAANDSGLPPLDRPNPLDRLLNRS